MPGDFFMRSKRRRISRRKKPAKINFPWFKLIILVLLLYFIANIIEIIRSAGYKTTETKYIPGNSLGSIPLTPPATPTPTLIPTPTQIPLIGYCLNVPVLMYHHIQPAAEAQNKGQGALSIDSGEFDLQMGYLAGKDYSFISAHQLVDALASHGDLPSKSIVITMDDGYSDIYAYAYPILQKYHIIANIGVITGLVGGADYLSWGQIEEMSHSGLVYMVNHTWSHYSITHGSSDKVEFEIATAKQQLRDHTGQNMDTFIYPYGAVNSSAIAALQKEGIRGAFSEIWGRWQCDSFIMALHRTRVGNTSLSYYGL
jgi:peptidoglycan/xylan/chitin deacetylase (PgdA/CDA1 family)